MQLSGKKAAVTGVSAKRRFTDGAQVADVYYIEGGVHANGFLMVYMPKEKLRIEADAYTPGAPNAPAPTVPNALHINLAPNFERQKSGVDQILPLVGRVVPLSEFYTSIGKKM